jgi:5'-nucleotidase
MDGVLCNLEKGCFAEWRRKYESLSYVEPADRVTHDIRVQYDTLGEGFGAKMAEIMRGDGFYMSLEPIDGAVDAMRAMLECGWEVFICTAQARNARCIAEKAAWVEANLGKEWVGRLIATRDKTLVCGDVLIDDKPRITGLRQPMFTHILYDQPYNRQETRDRLTWETWREVLIPLLGCAVKYNS